MTVGQRVRLFMAADGASAAAASSRFGSERDIGEGFLEAGDSFSFSEGHQRGSVQSVPFPVANDMESMRAFVAHLETMQAQQRSPQQPNKELDAELAHALSAYPEWRQRMAITTKSALLRKKILTTMAPGARCVGSSGMHGSHPWRKDLSEKYFTDSNWPNSTAFRDLHGQQGGSSPGHDRLRSQAMRDLQELQSGSSSPSQDRLVRSQAKHVLRLTSSPASESMPKAKRFSHSIDGEEHATNQKRSSPGPGAYFKSQPRGTAFSVDGGETVVLGANHIAPWKKVLGHNINPVHVDGTTLRSSPCFSFSKTRRCASDTAIGHGCQDGGPAKTDRGCLSPGPAVYELHGTFQPSKTSSPGKPRIRKSASTPKIRMKPVPTVEEYFSMDDDDSSSCM